MTSDRDTSSKVGAESTQVGPATLGSLAPSRDVSGLAEISGSPEDRYAIGEMIGRGGMGEVRLARDQRIGRDVAIKLLRRDTVRDADAIARFVREAQVQGRLDHPAVVPIHDLAIDRDGMPYFVMKRLTGTTLAGVLDRGSSERWSRRILLTRLVDVGLAVEFAHTRGVIHRDLKPANIMLGDFGEAYVLDWGLARVLEDRPSLVDARAAVGVHHAAETVAGDLLGTPGYMSPEQMRGDSIDRRTDVFALGCILYEILTGHPALPRGGEAFEATLAASEHRPSTRWPDADVPPELDALCARATAGDPATRLGSVRELAEAIQAYLDGDRDIAVRRALSADHAAAARNAFENNVRPLAMQEAGRAIALDAGNVDAQALLGRLLLDAPALPPPEAAHAIDIERVRARQQVLRTASYLYALYLLGAPAMLFFSIHTMWPVAAMIGLLAGNTALTHYGGKSPRPIQSPLFLVAMAINVGVLALTGIIFSPLLLMPFSVVGSVASFAGLPSGYRPATVLVAHALAVATPFALEATHVLPRTFTLDASGLSIHPWVIDFDARALAFLISAFVLQIANTWFFTVKYRRVQEAAQDRVHLYSWHLSHLVPKQPTNQDEASRP